MPRTIQCSKCGVVLNLPPQVGAGKRLKCPRCATKFVVSDKDASSISTVPGMSDAAPTSYEMPKWPPSGDELPNATSEGDLRDTFDLPLSGGSADQRGETSSSPATADAAGLFADSGPARRRVSAAEARAKARRCSHCGSGVPPGMSICQTCGTDQETGMRVGLEDDLAPPPPMRPQGPPLHIAVVGGLVGTGGIILALLGVIQSTRGSSDLDRYAWLVVAFVSAFGIFAAVQLIRGKSAKQLMLATTLGVVLNLLGLVAYPVLAPLIEGPAVDTNVKVEDTDDHAGIVIKPFEDRIDSQRIKVGVGFVLLYAVLSMYLISPPVKKYIFQCRPDRGL
jgi:phage FluMu protein Com